MSMVAASEGAEGRRIRILHVISGLGVGGAEKFLLRLVAASSGEVDGRIVSLTEGGGMAPLFRASAVHVSELAAGGRSGLLRFPRTMPKLVGEIRAWRPQIIQGWLNHGNVAASIIQGMFSRDSKVIWCIRQSFDAIDLEKPGTRAAITIQRFMSSLPAAVICNSARSQRQFSELIRGRRELKVIPNGFDTAKFAPDSRVRESARVLMGAAPEDFVVAMVARNHAMKDYPCFIEAISRVAHSVPHLRAVCIGGGVASGGCSLRPLIAKWRLEDRFTLLEERADLDQIYPGVDLSCLTSSRGEGFPNVLGEAMACGVPCVATDVGDAAAVLGEAGYLVRPQSAQEVADAILKYCSLDHQARARLGCLARRRIAERYSMPAIASRYMQVYKEVLRIT